MSDGAFCHYCRKAECVCFIRDDIREVALDDADFTNVFQAKTAWEMGFNTCYKILTRKHVYWRAGEPDCPKGLKALNGELHTLKCKVCGGSRGFCYGADKGGTE